MANKTEPDVPTKPELNEITSEPLAGSGFEAEESETEFDDSVEETEG